MNSYGDMNRVLITDDVDAQCVDMLVANGFSVEKDIKLAKQTQEQFIQRVQVRCPKSEDFNRSIHHPSSEIGSRYSRRSKCNESD